MMKPAVALLVVLAVLVVGSLAGYGLEQIGNSPESV